MTTSRQGAHLAVVEPPAPFERVPGRRDQADGTQLPAEKPRLPDLPDEIRNLVRPTSSRRRFSEGGEFLGTVEEWRIPEVTPEQLPEIRRCLSAVEKALAPPDRGALLTRVLALLSHYRAEANPPQVERLMAEDWAEDLEDFPMWAVEEAARWWRRNRKFRPAICEMRALCEAAVQEELAVRDRLRAIVRKHGGGDATSAASRYNMLAVAALRRLPGTSSRRP